MSIVPHKIDIPEGYRRIYRLLDAEGRLLHIASLTTSPAYFIQHHKTDEPWARHIYTWEAVVTLPYLVARKRLKDMIAEEKPIFQRVNMGWKPKYRPPEITLISRPKEHEDWIARALEGIPTKPPSFITPAMIRAGLNAIDEGMEDKDMVVAVYLAMQRAK